MLDGAALFRDQPARERALAIFSHLRIWDTTHNNGDPQRTFGVKSETV